MATRSTEVFHLDRSLNDLTAPDDRVGKILVYLVAPSFFALPNPHIGRHRAAFVPLTDGAELTSFIPAIDQLVR